MGSVYTRKEWNDLLDKINNLSQNPPKGCGGGKPSPLQHVDAGHVWSWSNDIQPVQAVLKDICSDNKFNDYTIWKQAIIDEINAAISKGWCGCLECKSGGMQVSVPLGPMTSETTVGNLVIRTYDMTDVLNGIPIQEPSDNALAATVLFYISGHPNTAARANVDPATGATTTAGATIGIQITSTVGEPPPTSMTGVVCCAGGSFFREQDGTILTAPILINSDGWRPC